MIHLSLYGEKNKQLKSVEMISVKYFFMFIYKSSIYFFGYLMHLNIITKHILVYCDMINSVVFFSAFTILPTNKFCKIYFNLQSTLKSFSMIQSWTLYDSVR